MVTALSNFFTFLLEMWKGYTIFAENKNREMKIVYVYDAIARIGGVERILVDKMNYLAEVYGYEIYLITAAQGLHPFSFPLSDKVKHVDIDARFHVQYQYKYPKRLWVKWKMDRDFKHRLQKQIAFIDPDIIIGTTYYKADVICRLKCRAKKIIESHCAKAYTGQNDGVKRNIFLQWFHTLQLAQYYRTVERKSDVIVALTKGDATEWKKTKNVFVIPNMIPQIPEAKTSCEIHRVISAGRLIYQKGYDLLIESWKLVYSKHPDWKLDIFGNGPLCEELQKQISQNKLDNVVMIHPPTDHITEEFLHSSIYVMSSRFEGFGLVLIEAMACGLPCISYKCPYGPSDIITHKEDGLLIPSNDIQQLSENIIYLIENEKKRIKYGEKAAINAKRFLSNNIMPHWNHLFKSLI